MTHVSEMREPPRFGSASLSDDDGGGRSGLATFAGVALVLGAAIGGAAIWRVRNGA